VQADAMAALERVARAPQGFVPASSGPQHNGVTAPVVTVNPDAIDMDEMDDD